MFLWGFFSASPKLINFALQGLFGGEVNVEFGHKFSPFFFLAKIITYVWDSVHFDPSNITHMSEHF